MPGTGNDAKESATDDFGGVTGESSASNSDGAMVDDNSDNLISTIDDDGSEDYGGVDASSGGQDVQDGLKAETDKVLDVEDTTDKVETKTDTTDKVETETETETKTETKADEIPERFDKHPAWQRLMTKIDNLETKLAEKPAVETKTDTDTIDIDTLTDEEIAEWRNDDPKGYDKNLQALITQRVTDSITAKTKADAEENRMAKTFDTYADENKDNDTGTGFMQMWNSGQLQTYINQNPGHNAISAHLKLTETSKAQSIKDQIAAGIAEGVAAEKKRLAAESKARRRTVGLNQGPAYTAKSNNDDELKDTKKYGGTITVMANRLKRMRQQSGA